MADATGQAIRDFMAQALIDSPRSDLPTIVGRWIRQAGREPSHREFVALTKSYERRTGSKFALPDMGLPASANDLRSFAPEGAGP